MDANNISEIVLLFKLNPSHNSYGFSVSALFTKLKTKQATPRLAHNCAAQYTACNAQAGRWCPEYLSCRVQCCCLPLHPKRRLSQALKTPSTYLSYCPQLYLSACGHAQAGIFLRLNTEPAILIHPAPNSRYRVYLRISLLTCRLGFSQVGLS